MESAFFLISIVALVGIRIKYYNIENFILYPACLQFFSLDFLKAENYTRI